MRHRNIVKDFKRALYGGFAPKTRSVNPDAPRIDRALQRALLMPGLASLRLLARARNQLPESLKRKLLLHGAGVSNEALIAHLAKYYKIPTEMFAHGQEQDVAMLVPTPHGERRGLPKLVIKYNTGTYYDGEFTLNTETYLWYKKTFGPLLAWESEMLIEVGDARHPHQALITIQEFYEKKAAIGLLAHKNKEELLRIIREAPAHVRSEFRMLTHILESLWGRGIMIDFGSDNCMLCTSRHGTHIKIVDPRVIFHTKQADMATIEMMRADGLNVANEITNAKAETYNQIITNLRLVCDAL